MPKQMFATVCINLPADEFDEADTKLKVRPLWLAWVKSLSDAGIEATAKLETIESRTKPAATNGRTRKQRVSRATTPTLVPTDPPAAA